MRTEAGLTGEQPPVDPKQQQSKPGPAFSPACAAHGKESRLGGGAGHLLSSTPGQDDAQALQEARVGGHHVAVIPASVEGGARPVAAHCPGLGSRIEVQGSEAGILVQADPEPSRLGYSLEDRAGCSVQRRGMHWAQRVSDMHLAQPLADGVQHEGPGSLPDSMVPSVQPCGSRYSTHTACLQGLSLNQRQQAANIPQGCSTSPLPLCHQATPGTCHTPAPGDDADPLHSLQLGGGACLQGLLPQQGGGQGTARLVDGHAPPAGQPLPQPRPHNALHGTGGEKVGCRSHSQALG